MRYENNIFNKKEITEQNCSFLFFSYSFLFLEMCVNTGSKTVRNAKTFIAIGDKFKVPLLKTKTSKLLKLLSFYNNKVFCAFASMILKNA